MLFQRGNLFLLAQSLLVVAYSTILSAESGPSQSALVAARVIAVFGLPLTGVWLYAGHRHLRYSRALQHRAASQLPDYAETQVACHQPGLGATSLIVYGLPSLAAGMWLTLLLVS